MNGFGLIWRTLLVLLALSLDPGEIAAQVAGEEKGSRLIEEVIVTAQKRAENLKDVPITINAYGAEKLDALSIVDSGDLPRVAPGLTINNRIGLATTFLRGVGSNAFLLGDPLVVTYIDGVYFPFAGGQVQDLGSVERVEVLKGPQGTLFGRNALGGAISINTRDPSFDQAQLSAQMRYGERYDARSARAYLSVPVLDSLAISGSGFLSTTDSYRQGKLDNAGRQRDLPSADAQGFRVKVLWEPRDDVSLQLNYYENQLESAEPYAVNTSPSTLGRAAGITPQDPYGGVNNDVPFIDSDTETVFGQLSLTLDWFDLKLFGSDQQVLFLTGYDFDGSVQPLAVFGSTGDSDVQTAELQILSNASAPSWLQWNAGVYFFRSDAGFVDAYLRAGGVNLAEGTLANMQLPAPLVSLLQPVAALFPSDQLTIGLNGVLNTESLAYYLQTTFDLSDSFAITLGARYQEEERYVAKSDVGVVDDANNYILELQSFSADDDPSLRDTTRSLDPKLSLNYRPQGHWLSADSLIYLSYQTATSSSTFNSLNITDSPEKVRSTEIVAYELGLKTRFFDGLVDFNAAVFHYDIEDPQVQVISLFAGGAVSFENAESQQIDGFEFDATIQMLPAYIDNLVVTASAAWLDAVYSSFKNGSGFDPTTGLFSAGSYDFTGNKIAGSPDFSGTLGLLKTYFTRQGAWELGLNIYHSDETFALAQNSEDSRIDAFTTVGANISYLHESAGLRVTLFGTNILDEKYKSSRFVTDFGPNDTVAARASYGVRINIDL